MACQCWRDVRLRAMRFVVSVSCFVLLAAAGCAPVKLPPARPVTPPVQAGASAPAAMAVPRRPLAALDSVRMTSGTFAGIEFEGVAFDARSHRLVVADQPGGPGSPFADAAAAGRARHGLAAVNGGFFTPAGAPLGLVMAAGKRSGAWNSASSLGSGVWHEAASGQTAITRREQLGQAGASSMRELVQAGPMLIDHGRAVTGLDALKASVRTMILWDGASRWWIGRASACTLAELGAALTAGGPADWPVVSALNLDGGRSSDLWIGDALTAGSLVRRAPWNRPVRNFLILTPR